MFRFSILLIFNVSSIAALLRCPSSHKFCSPNCYISWQVLSCEIIRVSLERIPRPRFYHVFYQDFLTLTLDLCLCNIDFWVLSGFNLAAHPSLLHGCSLCLTNKYTVIDFMCLTFHLFLSSLSVNCITVSDFPNIWRPF